MEYKENNYETHFAAGTLRKRIIEFPLGGYRYEF